MFIGRIMIRPVHYNSRSRICNASPKRKWVVSSEFQKVNSINIMNVVSTNESMQIYAVTPFPLVFHSIGLGQGH